MRTIRIFH